LDLAFNEAMVNVPMDLPFPLAFADLRVEQEHDDEVMNLLLAPTHELQEYHGTPLVCKRANNNEWRIVLPNNVVDDVVQWYHAALMHSGEVRTLRAISRYFYSFKLKDRVHDYVSHCDDCQRNKSAGAGYGELPPRNDVSIPWEEVAVDLIGPWNINIPGLGVISIRALTIIDTCSGLAEIIRIPDKYSATMAHLFDVQWLSRYPRPLRCIHDPGTEFVGPEFQTLLVHLGIQPVPSTVKNPQSNAICERLHATVGDMLRATLHSQPPNDVPAALDLIDGILASAQFATRAAVHTTLGVSPGALVFQRDMVLPIPLIANYEHYRARRQARIDENSRKENLRRQFKDYTVGDEVLILAYKPNKLDPRATGPFVISQVHANGTVTIQRNNHVYQRINIRRVKPYLR
jgi:transposase InsO family protein